MMDWAKRAVNYRFRKERLNSLPSQEVEFLGKNTRRESFGIPLESPGAVPSPPRPLSPSQSPGGEGGPSGYL